MMKYYQITRKLKENSTLLYKVSHRLIELSSGKPLPANFNTPFVVRLDESFIHGEMATFYTSPAIIVNRSFYEKLKTLKVKNVEIHPVIIKDNVHNKEIDDYYLLNIIGTVSVGGYQ